MKKRKSISELLDSIMARSDANAARDEEAFAEELGEEAYESADPLARLGEAFLARLAVPEGMSDEEAVEKIISMWNEADELRAMEDDGEEDEPFDDEEFGSYEEQPIKGYSRRLPAPIRGGLFEAPKADYESMSAEQFRRLKKQLQRANMDGRKVRL